MWSRGSNEAHTDYWSGGHHHQIELGVETDAAHVYAALGEFLRTHERPTCVSWHVPPRPQPAPFATGTIHTQEVSNLTARLREFAATGTGHVWWLNLGDPVEIDGRHLLVGVRGERGALVWYASLDEADTAVPAHGLNAEPVDYVLASAISSLAGPTTRKTRNRSVTCGDRLLIGITCGGAWDQVPTGRRV